MINTAKKILVIDDSSFFRGKLSFILENAGYEVITASNGEEGLCLAIQEKPDLILLDLILPNIDGFEVCRALRDFENGHLTPIFILSSRCAQDDKLTGLELGADDYITKPFHERELLSRIRNTLHRIDHNRGASPLTGLPGNLEIQREIESRIANGAPFAVIYIDLDNFKPYNDIYGFVRGDMLIRLTADILRESVALYGEKDDFLGHIGGDDFVLATSPDRAPQICENTISSFGDKVSSLFNRRDLERGYISTKNRRGEVDNFPITSISMCVVTNERRVFHNSIEVAEVATELKCKVKTLVGSNYMIDRRSDE